ncbi:hypothetical protein CN520_24455 [Bacillus cereus]|uniref:hypothetical protein n=1 Tax=Bacillus cereus TaxID=1396 RepID=UPI000BF99059|nr:hypothetical protein [Bacillus cereus]PET37894.1 hypothetical protein CN520_24455 [Bacillus cereus]PEY79070.1 hypothetical protein CN344_10510 [Bacillus cereus]PFW12851.1 hypothetical protein COL12_03085 [Bacillus cereus]PGP76265.1 hypothetical protein CN999_28100 [Bacillus cereus]
MKKKFITFALLAGMSLTAIGAQHAFAKSPPSKNCHDDTFDLRFKQGNSYDETDPQTKFSPSYIYFNTQYISVGGVRIWAKAGSADASDGHSYVINSPGVTLLYNRVIEDHLSWWQEGVDTKVAASKNASSQMKGLWSPDYC